MLYQLQCGSDQGVITQFYGDLWPPECSGWPRQIMHCRETAQPGQDNIMDLFALLCTVAPEQFLCSSLAQLEKICFMLTENDVLKASF